MSTALLRDFLGDFDVADVTGEGRIDFDAFKPLIARLLQNDSKETAKRYFDGIDFLRTGEISKEEFKALVEADATGKIRLLFRAFDQSRSRVVDAADVKRIGEDAGVPIAGDAGARIESITGSRAGRLNYAQVVKVVTNRDIEPTTDPYDGQLPARATSRCCLLL
jgi:hypothetical protein